MAIRTLVLSGGGGRGAFHAGVYEYLCKESNWSPDIVVGTSVGAVNGAAIVQGISPEELKNFWFNLEACDMEALPPGIRGVTYWGARWFLKKFLKLKSGYEVTRISPEKALSPSFSEAWIPLPGVPAWMSDRLIGRLNSFLDPSPLRDTLLTKLHLNPEKIANSDKILLVNATNVRTGELVTFSSRDLSKNKTTKLNANIKHGITIKRILASYSIPLVYPWTLDDDGEAYWDGAIVGNSPLGAAINVVKDYPIEEPMETIVALMTPWRQSNGDTESFGRELPSSFEEVLTYTIDWGMLASLRAELAAIRAFNVLAQQQKNSGQPITRREIRVTVVAPTKFLPLTRVIDYDREASQEIIELGYEAAKRAFVELR